MVVCLGLLAERLHEHPDGAGLAIYVLVFATVWYVWTTFVLYVNLASEGTRVTVLMTAAGLIGLMTAAMFDLDERANAFALGFILCRVVATGAAVRTGRILTSWPVARTGALTAPWIVSLWVDEPAKYVIWAVALGVELAMTSLRASDDPAAVDPGRAHGFVPVGVRAEHLGERLGLFMIIVIGEGVTEVFAAAAEAEWRRGLGLTVAGAFLTLVGLWWMTFRTGATGSLLLFPLRVALPLHMVVAGCVITFSTALGVIVPEPQEAPDTFWRLLACAGLGGWFLVGVALAARAGDPAREIALRAGPPLAALAALAAAGADAEGMWVIVILLAAVWWAATGYRRVSPR